MTLEQLNKLAEDYGMIVVVLALIIAIIVALRKAWPAISQFVHFVDVMVAVPTTFQKIDSRLATMESKIHVIEHEIKPNSGKSMKDQSNRNEKNVDQIKQALGISGT